MCDWKNVEIWPCNTTLVEQPRSDWPPLNREPPPTLGPYISRYQSRPSHSFDCFWGALVSEKAIKMEFFRKLMTFIGISRPNPPKIDILKDLPTELSQLILSKLDTQSLHNASQVSRTWLSLCKSTSSFRQRIRRHIRRRYRKLSQVLPPPTKKINNPIKPTTTVPQHKILICISTPIKIQIKYNSHKSIINRTLAHSQFKPTLRI